MKTGRAVVVGAGVVGASCAYYLARSGWEVDLIDQGAFGEGCSHGNCGYICPSHVFPLCRPGAIAKTLPLVMRRNSPFMIRPRLDWKLLSWLGRFAASCREDLMHETSVALHSLLEVSKRCSRDMVGGEGIECDWQDIGCLFIAMHEAHLDAFEGENKQIKERFGFCAKRLTGAELAAMEPTLRDGLGGAWFFECDAHIRPDRFMSGLRPVLERMGVRVHESRAAVGLRGGTRARSLDTSRGAIDADVFVIAAGAWTGGMSDMLGFRPPIEPGKGYSLTSPRPAVCPTYPMIFEEHRVAVTPWKSGFRVGSTMEFAGFDRTIRPERLQLLTDSARLYFREWPEPAFDEQWYGWRPMTPDGRPYIGASPRFPNVMIAAGHNMIGMSTGPGTGMLVRDLVTGESPCIDPRPFRINR